MEETVDSDIPPRPGTVFVIGVTIGITVLALLGWVIAALLRALGWSMGSCWRRTWCPGTGRLARVRPALQDDDRGTLRRLVAEVDPVVVEQPALLVDREAVVRADLWGVGDRVLVPRDLDVLADLLRALERHEVEVDAERAALDQQERRLS